VSARVVERVAEVPVVVWVYSGALSPEDFVVGNLLLGRTPDGTWDTGCAPPSFSTHSARPRDPAGENVAVGAP
jgi:hypothetical protein